MFEQYLLACGRDAQLPGQNKTAVFPILLCSQTMEGSGREHKLLNIVLLWKCVNGFAKHMIKTRYKVWGNPREQRVTLCDLLQRPPLQRGW
jgi:hypothetical protein